MFNKQLNPIFFYQIPEEGGHEGPPPGDHHEEGPPPGDHHEEGPPPEQHHEEHHEEHAPPPEQHHEEHHEEHAPPPEQHHEEHHHEDQGWQPPADEAESTKWGAEGPPIDASPEQHAKWESESEATKWGSDPAASMGPNDHPSSHSPGEYGPDGGGEYGAYGGGEYGPDGGGEYGAYGGGEYGTFDPNIPPAAHELTDAPTGVKDLFAMAESGDITFSEAYEQAEENFDWQSDAQMLTEDGEYGSNVSATSDRDFNDGVTDEVLDSARGAAPPVDDLEDEDEDEDWDNEYDDHDHLEDLDDEDEDDDHDSGTSPYSGR